MTDPLTDEQIEEYRDAAGLTGGHRVADEGIAEFVVTIDALRERLAAAEELLLDALPILKPDAPLRHYVNDAVRDRIVRFLAPTEKQP